VSNMLLDFMHGDATARPWYVSATVAALPPAVPGIGLAIAPNPGRGAVEIAFVPGTGGRWRLEVLDLAGRRVRELGSGLGDGTLQTRRWDARDARGAGVRAGVYWVRLVSAGHAHVRRLAILGSL